MVGGLWFDNLNLDSCWLLFRWVGSSFTAVGHWLMFLRLMVSGSSPSSSVWRSVISGA